MFLLAPGLSVAATSLVGLKIRATQPGVSGPVCVRAAILKSDGTYLDGEWLDPGFPAITMRGKAMTPDTVVQVPTGVTRITIGKGPDYLPVTITTNLTGALPVYTIDVALQPALDFYSRGWRAADMHVHYIHGEGEIIREPQDAWAICAAGGLNFVLFCEEHLGAGTYNRQQMLDLWAPYLNSECQLGLGVEEPKNAWGHHVNVLSDPWSIRSALPYYWGINSVHKQGGVSYPVHPERQYPSRYYDDPGSGLRTWFLFPFNNYTKAYPLDAMIGHLLDGWSGVSDQANTIQVLPPYFRLLAMGYRIPLLADSDFCMDRINNGYKATGCWMNYLYLGGQPLTRAAIAEAIRQGRVMSTTGPMVLFNIDNAISGDTLPADGRSRTLRIQASYAFNPWTLGSTAFDGSTSCRIARIDLYRNGQAIQSWTPNTPAATVQTTINESASNAYYMVRVLGNDPAWMAGYASPIYFDNAPRPRQPPAFKTLVQGRLYDAASGLTLTGTVSSVRYGRTDWSVPTDSQGRFQAYVPLDADLVARDSAGRTFTQNALKKEAVYSFGHYLPENYGTNQEASINAFSNVVRQMKWEFPLGYQLAASYVRTNLAGDAAMASFSVASAPAATPGKNSEIVMLIVDKTQAQIGDRINYAVIYRSQQQPPTDLLEVEWRGWNPQYPTGFNKYNGSVLLDNNPAALVALGNGFYLRQGSVVVPSWVANVTETSAGLQMWVTARTGGPVVEDAQVLVPLGPTQRQLLVSTTWDGLPASWSEIGIGPCNFRRDYTDFLVRYSDYRLATVNLTLNGTSLSLRPKVDTAHVADADDAVFYEPFYYDGQCEPQWRNIPFRDAVRTQPPDPDFSSVPIQNPPDTTPPLAVAIHPAQGASVLQTNVSFYFLVDDMGLSGPASATVYLDGSPVTNATTTSVLLNLSPGNHTWTVRGFDTSGNSAFSATNSFRVGPVSPPAVAIVSPTNNAVVFGPSVPISASATSSAGVAGVQLMLDGADFGPPQPFAPYTLTWDTTASAAGPHQLAAIAQDLVGNQSTSAVVTVTVNNNTVVSNVVWVEDALPAGAQPGADGGDAWTWVSSNPAPFSGTLAHRSNLGSGEHQHFFTGATATLPVNTNDSLFAYVYLDPASVPGEVMLQWLDSSWEHRAYWGSDSITAWGTPGTSSRRYMGPLPAAGQWVRLSVPASQVALEGSVLRGMAFTLYGGRATWDYAGKSFLTLPNGPVPFPITGGFTNQQWQVRFPSSGSSFSYTLLRSQDLKAWTSVASVTGVTNATLVLQDPNPPVARAFYRVLVQ